MRNKLKRKIFQSVIVLTGVLIFGTPVCDTRAEGAASGEPAETGEPDHDGEGRIHKPAYLTEDSKGEKGQAIIDDPTDNSYGYYTIMGETTVELDDMTWLFECQGVEYPSEILSEGGAATIEDFCSIIMEEANAEDIRAEVVFTQSMLETGWLQYNGDSSAEQFNFAGLGTTGGGVKGIYFPDVRTGIRAQVQHLKAYACSDALNLDCVDERFDLVSRETAPYVEWLGIQENPYGAGWAAGEDYGYKIRRILAELKGTEYTMPDDDEEIIQEQ